MKANCRLKAYPMFDRTIEALVPINWKSAILDIVGTQIVIKIPHIKESTGRKGYKSIVPYFYDGQLKNSENPRFLTKKEEGIAIEKLFLEDYPNVPRTKELQDYLEFLEKQKIAVNEAIPEKKPQKMVKIDGAIQWVDVE